MTDVKKAIAAAKPVAKSATKSVAAEAVKEAKAESKTPAKETVKKTPAKKTTAKKTTAAKKVEEKEKEVVEKKAPAAKNEKVETNLNFQFSGKEYKAEDFVNIAKDVWKYDLGNKVSDFKSVELYIKPEENKAYYVINGDVSGNFDI